MSMSAAGPSQGANSAPLGGSAGALVSPATSVGVHNPDPIIRVVDVDAGYEGTPAILENVNFDVARGQASSAARAVARAR